MPYPPNKIRAVLLEGVHPIATRMLEAEGFVVVNLAKIPQE
jgi:hypothetical protein